MSIGPLQKHRVERGNFMFSWVEHEICFITSVPGFWIEIRHNIYTYLLLSVWLVHIWRKHSRFGKSIREILFLPFHPLVSQMGSLSSEFGHIHCCNRVSSKKINNRIAKSVVSDATALYEPSHLDLHCLQRYQYWSAGLKELIPSRGLGLMYIRLCSSSSQIFKF